MRAFDPGPVLLLNIADWCCESGPSSAVCLAFLLSWSAHVVAWGPWVHDVLGLTRASHRPPMEFQSSKPAHEPRVHAPKENSLD